MSFLPVSKKLLAQMVADGHQAHICSPETDPRWMIDDIERCYVCADPMLDHYVGVALGTAVTHGHRWVYERYERFCGTLL